jgi:polyhydroxyalkanoate synthase subunit PhaC
MVGKLMQAAWDPLTLAGQFHKIARQSRRLMPRFVFHQTNAMRLSMVDITLGFDFFEFMGKMMTDPAAVARAQIDLFNNSLAVWQTTAERMLMLRADSD